VKNLRGMVLSAGLGNRLKPLTYMMAKPAVPFLGRPLIHYSLDMLTSLGIKDIAVNLHHLPDTVESALGGRHENILLSREKTILGTGGCLGKLRDYFSGNTIVLSNGKIYFSEASLEGALKEHTDKKSMVTMVLVPFQEGMPYKKVFLDMDHAILGFSRNISSGEELARISHQSGRHPFVYTGIQIIDPAVLAYIPDGYSDTVADIYPKLIKDGLPLRGYVSNGFWRECSTPGRYLQSSLDVMKETAPVPRKNGAASGDGIFAGHSVKIPADAKMRNCVIWDNSRIGSSSCFENVIIAGTSGALPDGLNIKRAVITPSLTGLPANLPADAKTGPGYIVWPLH
jgi:mannose-1-phosphate guanylyltransferase